MSTAYLIPRTGLAVLQPRDHKRPVPTPLPAEGATVTLTPYWRRRLADGDVTAGEPPAPAPTPAKTAKATKTTTGE
ncbi:DUF2635 domain-containing protein [Stenotrophomonas sp. MMGLT7]|uniref:DUF2635 domain-containing protein n=1 Tax=Stenotrophomonas sp. MMGLT7 TaxID=2901227 RepID=UPI001E4DBE7B|nr:DUF2635 domain-containing protein [Stenotrophomonas sp. MMGLT7]MCD7099118.1 DUF2635 domain-containing protein [Stenotrophomonas sp. MMGLT7]